MPPRPEAPGKLETVRAFVNTLDVENATDALGTPAGLGAWLAERGLLAPQVRPTAQDRDEAVGLREALRALLLENNGAPPDEAAVDTLNAAARRARLEVRFEPSGAPSLVAQAGGVAGALGDILRAAHSAMAEGTWSRLKACPDDACHWAFYDHSRNLSGRWCSMEVCGNRNKGRAFRARRRHSPADAY